jgi:hypothetical protein
MYAHLMYAHVHVHSTCMRIHIKRMHRCTCITRIDIQMAYIIHTRYACIKRLHTCTYVVHVCIYTSGTLCMYTNISAYIYMYVHLYIYMYYMHIYIYVYIHMCICIHACIYTHIYTHMYKYTDICIYTFIHGVYTRVCKCNVNVY